MSLTLYIAVGIATLASKRTILGASSGGFTYGILSEWTSSISLIEVSTKGELGIYGLVFASGFYALVGVWAYNLFITRKYLVR
jgi:hypothetical protein